MIMNILNKIVSGFRNYRDAVPKDVNLLNFLTSDKYKDKVQQIRTVQDKSQRDRLKAELPAVTPSGRFEFRRTTTNLVEHTGIIQLDIDYKENKGMDIKEVKQDLMESPIVAYCAKSVSGTGLYALVPIAYPDKHKQHFLSLEKDMLEFYQIVIDKSCKDVTRLRGYSYDPEYYINQHATVYKGLITHETVNSTYPNKLSLSICYDKDRFRKAIETIVMYQYDITGNYNQWFEILCSIANKFGEKGRVSAHIISQFSLLYDENYCDSVYNEALEHMYSYTIGTFYHYFEQSSSNLHRY